MAESLEWAYLVGRESCGSSEERSCMRVVLAEQGLGEPQGRLDAERRIEIEPWRVQSFIG